MGQWSFMHVKSAVSCVLGAFLLLFPSFSSAAGMLEPPVRDYWTDQYLSIVKPPLFSLATGIYKKASIKLVSINPGHVTIHYTLDNTMPTHISPVLSDGSSIRLNSGRFAVRAICTDDDGRTSFTSETEYYISQPFKRYFRHEDGFSGIELMKTSNREFLKKYPLYRSKTETEQADFSDKEIIYSYRWGQAGFVQNGQKWVLHSIEVTTSALKGPRSTRVGMSTKKVTSAFRDYGQPDDLNGNRSIYLDTAEKCYAKLYRLSDSEQRIDYVSQQEDGSVDILSYNIQKDKVVKITLSRSADHPLVHADPGYGDLIGSCISSCEFEYGWMQNRPSDDIHNINTMYQDAIKGLALCGWSEGGALPDMGKACLEAPLLFYAGVSRLYANEFALAENYLNYASDYCRFIDNGTTESHANLIRVAYYRYLLFRQTGETEKAASLLNDVLRNEAYHRIYRRVLESTGKPEKADDYIYAYYKAFLGNQ